MGQLVCDDESENTRLTQELDKHYPIQNVWIASYHSQVNGLVERGHQPVRNTLAQLGRKWVKNLPRVV